VTTPTEAGWARFHGRWATQASTRWIVYRDCPVMSDALVTLPSAVNLNHALLYPTNLPL